MARPLRIEFPGALYHVTTRGNAAADIVADDVDRAALVELIGEVVERASWLCHTYCLMDNHYHLLVETPAPSLARGMRHLNGVYTQTFNRTHGRVGHVFQGRYKAILVEREAHLLEVCRYVVLNPVRAGLARDARAWRWSSYRATLAAAPAWLAADDLLALFAPAPGAARRIYAGFVAEGAGRDPGLWDRLEGQIYLGAAGFAEAMRLRAGGGTGEAGGRGGGVGDAEVPRAQRQAPPRPLPAFARRYEDRREAMARAHLEGGYSQAEVARHFGVHYSTVSRAARRLRS